MGKSHTAVLTNDGKLYTFGDGAYGALGNGNTSFSHTPNLVTYFESQNETVVQVDCGKSHSIALTESGKVFTWGKGDTRNFFTRPWIPAGNPLGIGECSEMRNPTKVSA